MKLSLASAGVAAGLVTLGWVIFGEQDTKNAETSLQDFQDAIFSAIKPRNAVAVLAPNDNGVAGVVHFTQEEDTVHIDYDITGLTDGEHGFHIHTYGDLTDGCDSACTHFNPDNTEHGGLDSKIRHLGDLGNISSEKGVSKGRLSTDTLSLKSGKRNCIVGRMIIVHADRDDLGKGGDAESLKTGNAGKRVGCGVIGLAKGEVKCAETLEAEKVWGEKIISGWSGSNLSKKKAESECSWCKKKSAKVRDVEYGGGGSICPNCHYAYRKLGYNPHKPQHPFKKKAESECSWCKKKSAKVRDVEYGGGGSICPNCHYAYRKLGYNPHKPQHPFKKSAEHKKMNPIEKPMIAGVTSRITADGLEDLMMAEDKATPIRHSRRLNGYYGIKGYDDASEDGFVYRIYRAPGTNDWFKAMVYDDNSMRDNFAKPTSRRLNPSGQMTISNNPPSLLIGAFPKFEDAKRALVFRMIQDGNYHHMITDGNLKWLLKGNR